MEKIEKLIMETHNNIHNHKIIDIDIENKILYVEGDIEDNIKCKLNLTEIIDDKTIYTNIYFEVKQKT